MIHLILDTNIYYADPKRESAGFTALLKLGANDDVKLYIPNIVEREFRSQCLGKYEILFKSIDDSIDTIKRKNFPKNLEKDISAQEESLKKLKAKVIRFSEEEWATWIINIKAEKCELLPIHTERMLEAYFNGLPPFSNKKARKDIPDSFIFEAVKDLSKKFNDLVFVCGDDRLRKAVESLHDIKTYSSLDVFIASETCQNILLEHSVREYMDDLIASQIKDNRQIFEKAINDLYFEAIIGKTLGDQSIPSDDQSATINSVGTAGEISIDYDQASYYGDGLLIVPFSLKTEVYADYFIYKADYYCMDETKIKRIGISDWNDHYFAAEEDFYVCVSGTLAFKIDTKKLKNEKNIKNLLKDHSFKIDSLENIEVIPPANKL
jgi:hypothetical protein